MALADKLTEQARRPTGKPCSIGRLLEELPLNESAALHSMMFELGWSYSAIWKALDAEGYAVSGQQINRHRSGACRCWKTAA